MRYHGIMVLRDEGDIIAHTLSHLLTWVDSLHFLDTGSTDGTWETVNDFARRDDRVRPVAREVMPFHNGLRAVLFNRVRHGFEDGDWFARLDADEIYHVPPPRFISERLAPHESRVFTQHYEFLMTKAQHRAWKAGEGLLADRSRPIESRLTRYVMQECPEPRLFKYRRSMRWPETSYVPLRGGLPAMSRIPVRHYRWRDPEQAARRCALRRAARAAGAKTGPHWELADYQEWLANDEDPRLLSWSPGQPLPDPGLRNHLPPRVRRLALHVLYRTGLVRVLDGLDRGGGQSAGLRWPADGLPQSPHRPR